MDPLTARITEVTEQLVDLYAAFSHGDLHLEYRDLVEEGIREFRDVGLELKPPDEPMPGAIHMRIVETSTDDEVGYVSRRIVTRESRLVAAHRQLRILRPALRGRGFGTALLEASEAWYRQLGIAAIIQEAEGDGSLFAARRGFDFDLRRYVSTRDSGGQTQEELRARAVRELIRRPGVFETIESTDRENPPQRDTVRALLRGVASQGGVNAELVAEFESRVPPEPPQLAQPDAFASPSSIAEFGVDSPLPCLGGAPLGRAVLRHTSWHAIKELPHLGIDGQQS